MMVGVQDRRSSDTVEANTYISTMGGFIGVGIWRIWQEKDIGIITDGCPIVPITCRKGRQAMEKLMATK
jgi:hypothetical protein